MTAITAHDRLFDQDDPVRRAIWVLPLAMLLVLLALLGFGMMLKRPMQKAPPPPPIRAEIYELPGKVGPKPRAESPAMGRAAPKADRPAPTSPKTPPKTVTAPPVPKLSPVTPAAPPKAATANIEKQEPKRSVPAKLPKRHGEIVERAVPRPKLKSRLKSRAAKPKPMPELVKPAQPEPPRHLSWAQLSAQIHEEVQSTVKRQAVERIRNPDSMVARYYLASVLRKLERVGQVTYQASMVGEAVVAIEIGPSGELLGLQLANSSGQQRIDDYARQIVRMSVPFAPFPKDLEKETPKLSIVVHMDFQGYRAVQAN
ncbi:MAG: TonB family protein [Chromatiaceae bacterium]